MSRTDMVKGSLKEVTRVPVKTSVPPVLVGLVGGAGPLGEDGGVTLGDGVGGTGTDGGAVLARLDEEDPLREIASCCLSLCT